MAIKVGNYFFIDLQRMRNTLILSGEKIHRSILCIFVQNHERQILKENFLFFAIGLIYFIEYQR